MTSMIYRYKRLCSGISSFRIYARKFVDRLSASGFPPDLVESLRVLIYSLCGSQQNNVTSTEKLPFLGRYAVIPYSRVWYHAGLQREADLVHEEWLIPLLQANCSVESRLRFAWSLPARHLVHKLRSV